MFMRGNGVIAFNGGDNGITNKQQSGFFLSFYDGAGALNGNHYPSGDNGNHKQRNDVGQSRCFLLFL